MSEKNTSVIIPDFGVYTIQAEKQSRNLLRGFLNCCKGYNIKFKNRESNWIPMESQKIKDLINTVEKEFPFSTMSFNPLKTFMFFWSLKDLKFIFIN